MPPTPKGDPFMRWEERNCCRRSGVHWNVHRSTHALQQRPVTNRADRLQIRWNANRSPDKHRNTEAKDTETGNRSIEGWSGDGHRGLQLNVDWNDAAGYDVRDASSRAIKDESIVWNGAIVCIESRATGEHA